jgi:hypothetical protein
MVSCVWPVIQVELLWFFLIQFKFTQSVTFSCVIFHRLKLSLLLLWFQKLKIHIEMLSMLFFGLKKVCAKWMAYWLWFYWGKVLHDFVKYSSLDSLAPSCFSIHPGKIQFCQYWKLFTKLRFLYQIWVTNRDRCVCRQKAIFQLSDSYWNREWITLSDSKLDTFICIAGSRLYIYVLFFLNINFLCVFLGAEIKVIKNGCISEGNVKVI